MSLALRDTVRPGDAANLRALAAASGVFDVHELDYVPEILDALASGGEAASGYRLLVAEAGGAAAGFAIWGPCGDEGPGAHDLYWIATRPDARSRGVGRLLLDEILRRARAEGATRMLVETEDGAAYRPAHRFYAAAGFAVIARSPGHYGPGRDRLIFAKTLP